MQSIHPKYRPDIDGLRAIAILSVIFFHVFPGLVPGGFIGVDIFFVISGFLITTILIENLAAGSFSFFEFYSRRIRRIFPALLVVLASSIILGWFVMLPDEFKQLGKHLIGAGISSNIVLINESGYFDNSAETKPLLHLWSLAVEEQFYIMFPLIMWVFFKKKSNLLFVILVMLLISFCINLIFIDLNKAATFFRPDARFWELLAGSLLAALTIRFPNKGWMRRLSVPTSFLGSLLICLGFLLINQKTNFPGWWSLLPVAGTIFLIESKTSFINKYLLSNQLLIWIGKISYPLYLWHWVLLSFARIIDGEQSSLHLKVAILFASFFLSWLTYQFIEFPLQKFHKNKNVVISLATTMIFLYLIGSSIYIKNGFNYRHLEFNKIANAKGEWHYPGSMSPYVVDGVVGKFLIHNTGTREATLFIGDSNMEQYYPRLDKLANDKKSINSLIFSTVPGCLPIPNSSYPSDFNYTDCRVLMKNSMELALHESRIKKVVIGSQWNAYFSAEEGLRCCALQGDYYVGSESYKKALVDLGLYLHKLKNAGKKVYIVLNIPKGNEIHPRFLASRSFKNFPDVITTREGGISLKVLREKYGEISSDLSKIAEMNGATVIDPLDYLCKDLFCPAIYGDGEPMYKDASHLRAAYVRDNVSFIDITVEK